MYADASLESLFTPLMRDQSHHHENLHVVLITIVLTIVGVFSRVSILMIALSALPLDESFRGASSWVAIHYGIQ